jgi:hypothetical protein
MMTQPIKIRKPHDQTVDEILKMGIKEIREYGRMGYLLRLNKENDIFKVRKQGFNDIYIAPNPNRRIQKNKKKSMGGKYAFYDLL